MNLKLKTNERLSATVTNGLAGIFVNGVSLSASLSGKADLTALQNYYAKSETSSANEISTALENAGSKVYFDNRISGVAGRDDLSVVRLSAAEYAQMLEDGECLSNAIYIVDAPNIDAFKQQIKNVAPPTDLSDAVNKEYVDSNFQPAGSYLTAHQPISAAYVNQHIRLSANNMLVGNIDCGDFVKDGMLSAVELCSDQLVFIFNAESGKATISVALSNFIDETNYYAKSETSSAAQISSALSSYLPLSGGNMAGALSVRYGDALGAKAPCIIIDAYEKNCVDFVEGKAGIDIIGDVDAAPYLELTRYGDDGYIHYQLEFNDLGIVRRQGNNVQDWYWPYSGSLSSQDPEDELVIANNADIKQYCAFKSETSSAAEVANAVKLLNDAKVEKSDIQWIPRWSEISSIIENYGECAIGISSLIVYNSIIYESKTNDFLTDSSLTPDRDSTHWQAKPGYKEEAQPWLYVGNDTRQYRYNGMWFSSVGMTINTAGDFTLGLGSNDERAADSINLNGTVNFDGSPVIYGNKVWDEARGSYYALENELGYALSTATGVLSSGSYVYDVADRTMTTIGINQSTTPVVVRLPAAGDRARDFILRIEISSETAPTFTFTNTAGLDFESEDDDWAVMQPGVNLISFTETKR